MKHKWDDGDEADFVKALAGELDKVVLFQESKVSLGNASLRYLNNSCSTA